MSEQSETKARTGAGGARAGAGRPLSGKEAKKPLPVKVSKDCRDDVKSLSEKLDISQAKVVEMAVEKFKAAQS